jgi:hypothetical protein
VAEGLPSPWTHLAEQSFSLAMSSSVGLGTCRQVRIKFCEDNPTIVATHKAGAVSQALDIARVALGIALRLGVGGVLRARDDREDGGEKDLGEAHVGR